ncbi:MAG TPA: hypothetical protein VNN80_08710, partial [Polyangiaceae bacterium]|nr:hypothetical protein [Polyangiaceae bacterium]
MLEIDIPTPDLEQPDEVAPDSGTAATVPASALTPREATPAAGSTPPPPASSELAQRDSERPTPASPRPALHRPEAPLMGVLTPGVATLPAPSPLLGTASGALPSMATLGATPPLVVDPPSPPTPPRVPRRAPAEAVVRQVPSPVAEQPPPPRMQSEPVPALTDSSAPPKPSLRPGLVEPKRIIQVLGSNVPVLDSALEEEAIEDLDESEAYEVSETPVPEVSDSELELPVVLEEFTPPPGELELIDGTAGVGDGADIGGDIAELVPT